MQDLEKVVKLRKHGNYIILIYNMFKKKKHNSKEKDKNK